MGAYENATCYTSVPVGACVTTCVCVCVCAHVCAHVFMNNEKAPCLGYLISDYVHIPYIRGHSSHFLSCGTIFLLLCEQVTWHCVERSTV